MVQSCLAHYDSARRGPAACLAGGASLPAPAAQLHYSRQLIRLSVGCGPSLVIVSMIISDYFADAQLTLPVPRLYTRLYTCGCVVATSQGHKQGFGPSLMGLWHLEPFLASSRGILAIFTEPSYAAATQPFRTISRPVFLLPSQHVPAVEVCCSIVGSWAQMWAQLFQAEMLCWCVGQEGMRTSCSNHKGLLKAALLLSGETSNLRPQVACC